MEFLSKAASFAAFVLSIIAIVFLVLGLKAAYKGELVSFIKKKTAAFGKLQSWSILLLAGAILLPANSIYISQNRLYEGVYGFQAYVQTDTGKTYTLPAKIRVYKVEYPEMRIDGSESSYTEYEPNLQAFYWPNGGYNIFPDGAVLEFDNPVTVYTTNDREFTVTLTKTPAKHPSIQETGRRSSWFDIAIGTIAGVSLLCIFATQCYNSNRKGKTTESLMQFESQQMLCPPSPSINYTEEPSEDITSDNLSQNLKEQCQKEIKEYEQQQEREANDRWVDNISKIVVYGLGVIVAVALIWVFSLFEWNSANKAPQTAEEANQVYAQILEDNGHNTMIKKSSKLSDDTVVWTVPNGNKYHLNPNCSNMKDPFKRTLQVVALLGYEPCSKCVK